MFPFRSAPEKKFGKSVAAKTVKVEIMGSDDVPIGSRAFVTSDPAVTSDDATEMEIAREDNVMLEVPSFSTVISAIVSVCFPRSASTFGTTSPTSSASPDFAIENRNAKYNATTTLSAATIFRYCWINIK